MSKLFITFLLCCLGGPVLSQYNFQGQVLLDDEPLVGAVVLYGDSDGVVTDSEGLFTFVFSEQTVNVKLTYLGFEKEQVLTSENENIISLRSEDLDKRIQPVFVSEKYPIAQTTISDEELENINLGQDIPILLEQQPSVVATSDAGAGVGYSGLRVRGSDATRVNVTINGVPVNDSESQGVFWVNMPDFASNTGNITLVRGAGTSTNGAGAFGASLHLETDQLSDQPFAEYNGSAGSFQTVKNNIQFGTGNQNGWSASGRLSKIKSDGYIDRARSDLQSYFFQAAHSHGNNKSNNGQIKFITFKGHEETYQAWYGVREDILQDDRTYNPYTYENQVDNYTQEHYQLHLDQNLSVNTSLNVGLHYTKGAGYYEEFREDDALENYGLNPMEIGGETISESTLVRRRWLDNDFYGLVSSFDLEKDNHYLNIGGGLNRYLGDHFGEIIRGEFIPSDNIGEPYYENDATKDDGNIYAKYTYDFETETGLLRPFVDVQYRNVSYDFVGLALSGSGDIQTLPQSVSHHFFNPKAGVSYESGNHQVYGSYARAQKEPNRTDYTESPASQQPVPEELNDFELGYEYQSGVFSGSVNGYYMDYTNQLALTGGVNDVGAYTRVNVPDSYRAGVELIGTTKFGGRKQFQLTANATFSQNKIDSFTEYIDDYDNGGLQAVEHTDTDLALSPNVIAGGNFMYKPSNTFQIGIISKYVGQQYLDNTSAESRSIDSYFVNNGTATLSLAEFIPTLKTVDVNLLVNNLFDVEYESNGYTFGYISGGETIYENYYYPQAGTNFLAGLTIRFE